MHRRNLLRLGALSALVPLVAPVWAQETGRLFDAADFGAVPDGEAIQTRALQAAIDAAAAAGGGTVVLKPGLYRAGAIFVKSNVTLHIGRGAILRGVTDLAAYPMVRTRVAGIEMEWPAGLLNIYQENNARITGEGVTLAKPVRLGAGQTVGGTGARTGEGVGPADQPRAA